MKLNQKTKSGISLIVLVITIIVMIILAAAIILSLNSSGIIGKANKAKADSDKANMLEAAGVAYAEYQLEKQMGELEDPNQTADEYVKDRLKDQFAADTLKQLSVLSDGTIQALPIIPEGFVMSPYAGEQKISEGLVIYEATAADLASKTNLEAMEAYNQYVWVPVEGTFERKAWNNENITTDYVEPLRAGINYMDDISNYADEIAQYNAMKASVETNGGFYIARYEAGKETINSVETAVSKKAANVWNNIAWDSTWNEEGYGVDTNDGAAKVSKKTYSNAERHLIYGVQWDATMNFMKDVDNPNSTTGKKYIYDSTRMGWYSDNYNNPTNGNADHKTGIDVDVKASNKVKNIYDMAGNVLEWTYEGNSYNGVDECGYRVMRGGYYLDNGSGYGSTVARSTNDSRPICASVICGFRFALYVK